MFMRIGSKVGTRSFILSIPQIILNNDATQSPDFSRGGPGALALYIVILYHTSHDDCKIQVQPQSGIFL